MLRPCGLRALLREHELALVLARARADQSVLWITDSVADVELTELGFETIAHLVQTLRTNGDLGEALRMGRKALATARRVFGEEHRATVDAMGVLGAALHDLGAEEKSAWENTHGRRDTAAGRAAKGRMEEHGGTAARVIIRD